MAEAKSNWTLFVNRDPYLGLVLLGSVLLCAGSMFASLVARDWPDAAQWAMTGGWITLYVHAELRISRLVREFGPIARSAHAIGAAVSTFLGQRSRYVRLTQESALDSRAYWLNGGHAEARRQLEEQMAAALTKENHDG